MGVIQTGQPKLQRPCKQQVNSSNHPQPTGESPLDSLAQHVCLSGVKYHWSAFRAAASKLVFFCWGTTGSSISGFYGRPQAKKRGCAPHTTMLCQTQTRKQHQHFLSTNCPSVSHIFPPTFGTYFTAHPLCHLCLPADISCPRA